MNNLHDINMASLRTKLEDELECSLCLERLKDPRVFPCQHSFCYQCIVDLSQRKSKMSCPECRAEVEVGDPPDLSHFKRNHRINNILEFMDNDLNYLQGSTNSDAQQQSNSSKTPICSDGTVQKTGSDAPENGNDEQQHRKNDSRSPTSMNYRRMASISQQSKMDVGSMVEILSNNQNPRYGVIRWIGFLPNSDKKIAGLELEEEMNTCTDGTFLGQRYFTCPNRRGFFVHLHNCLPDSRFNRNSVENSPSRGLTDTDVRTPASTHHQQTSNAPPQSKLNIGSMVEVLSKNKNPRYGVIRWIGFPPNSDKKIAGLELEEEMNACTDGTFLGQRYFTCPIRRGFFVHLHNCMPDSRFN